MKLHRVGLLCAVLLSGCDAPLFRLSPGPSDPASAQTQPDAPASTIGAGVDRRQPPPPETPVLDPQGEQAAADAGGVLNPSARTEFTMPGTGSQPPNTDDAAARRAAAVQAAIVVGIYNVTKELNDLSYSDPIERGHVYSDHYRYKAGLEVKSQTTVIDAKATQFDVWLVAPAGPREGQDKFQVHVRNFTLQGKPMNAEQLARLIASAGGHLAVTKVSGPDDKGLWTADVGLVRGER